MSNYSVYILEAPNGKRYVGMTMRKAIYRWNRGKGYLHNKAFYDDINSVGWENIKKRVIIENLTKEQACQAEQDLIVLYRSQDPRFGYNVEMGGIPTRLSETTKEKMSKAHIGKERDESYRRHISESKKGSMNGMYMMLGSLNPNASGVYSIDGDGNERFFDSMSTASRELHLSKNAFKNISACCQGKRKTAYGFKWRYADGH